MTGVLLINMGAPEMECEIKQFLRSMFLDKHIIPAPYFIRNLLSLYISNTRYKKSWARYQQIGGTPLKRNTLELAYTLQNKIGDNYLVKAAYSYSEPTIKQAIDDFMKDGINNIIVIPLYPQASITTTESVIYDLNKSINKYNSKNSNCHAEFISASLTNRHAEFISASINTEIPKQVRNDVIKVRNDKKKSFGKPTNLNIKIIPEFYSNKLFIDYWKELITNHIKKNNLTKPFLLFSAHSIPLSFIKKGDTYQKSIEESAKLISQAAELDYSFSYQSQMNEKKWLGPSTEKKLEDLKNKGYNEVVIIPISFVCENLETKYDLDTIIVPKFNSNNFNVSRVEIPAVKDKFVEMIIYLIHS